MFNFIKKIRNKDNTPKKGYNLSYDNLAIPEIHINGQDDESPDMAVTKETEQDTEGVDKKICRPYVINMFHQLRRILLSH